MPYDEDQPKSKEKLFVFRFSGYAEYDYENDNYEFSERKFPQKNSYHLAHDLNKDAASIQQEINYIIKSSLPTELGEFHVTSKIEFSEGSLEWVGEVVIAIFAVMNVLSAISGTVDFFEKLSKYTKHALEVSVLKAAKKRNARLDRSNMRVDVIQPVRINVDHNKLNAFEHILRQQDIQSRHLHEISQRQTLILNHLLEHQTAKKKEETPMLVYALGLIPWVIIFVLIYLLMK